MKTPPRLRPPYCGQKRTAAARAMADGKRSPQRVWRGRCLCSPSGGQGRSRGGSASCGAGGCGRRGVFVRCGRGCRPGRLGLSAHPAASRPHGPCRPAVSWRVATRPGAPTRPGHRASGPVTGRSRAAGRARRRPWGAWSRARLSCARWPAAAPPSPEACRRAVRLQMRAVHRDRLAVSARQGQGAEDAGEHPPARPAHKAVAEGLGGAVDRRSVLPPEPVAPDRDDPAQHPPIIHPRLAPRLGNLRPQPLNLCVCQPEPPAHPAPRSRAA